MPAPTPQAQRHVNPARRPKVPAASPSAATGPEHRIGPRDRHLATKLLDALRAAGSKLASEDLQGRAGVRVAPIRFAKIMRALGVQGQVRCYAAVDPRGVTYYELQEAKAVASTDDGFDIEETPFLINYVLRVGATELRRSILKVHVTPEKIAEAKERLRAMAAQLGVRR